MTAKAKLLLLLLITVSWLAGYCARVVGDGLWALPMFLGSSVVVWIVLTRIYHPHEENP